MTDFTQFRVVEAYGPVVNTSDRDGMLHLASNARDFQTICRRDGAKLTQLRFRDFGRPDAVDVTWCKHCVARLRILENAAMKEPTSRKGYVKMPESTVQAIAHLVALGMNQKEASERLGVPQSSASKALRRMRETQARATTSVIP